MEIEKHKNRLAFSIYFFEDAFGHCQKFEGEVN